jgi:hypothetical protein
MRNLSFLLSTLLAGYTLVSCQNDSDEMLQNTSFNEANEVGKEYVISTEKVSIKNGILKFESADFFQDYLNGVNTDQIEAKISQNEEFKSLEAKYASIEASAINVLRSEVVEENPFFYEDFIENYVNSYTLSSLLNKDGILIIGTDIYKFEGDYAYIISNEDYDALEKLKKGIDYTSLENVSYQRIIEPLVNEDEIEARGSSGGTYNRSFVFVTTKSSFRREHVRFSAYLSLFENETSIHIEMEGRAQKGEKILGKMIWGTTFSDEMVRAEIHLNSGSWYGIPAGSTFNPSPGFTTNYFSSGIKAWTNGKKVCRWIALLAKGSSPKDVKANITFKMKKSDYQPSDWQSTYTNNYKSIYK